MILLRKEKVDPIVDEVIGLINEKTNDLETKNEIARRIRAHYMTCTHIRANDTIDFLMEIDGIGLEMARVIAKSYPTVKDLASAKKTDIAMKSHIGNKTVQKIYKALLKEGEIPTWRP